jgi:prophage antirepressor-like protein
MIKIGENSTHEIFEDYYENQQVRFYKNKQTGEIVINADDCARVLGYADAQAMLSSDEALDAANEQAKVTGVFPFKTVLN